MIGGPRDADRGTAQTIGVVMLVAIAVVLAGAVAYPLLSTAEDTSQGARASANVAFEPGDGDGRLVVAFLDSDNAEYLEVNYTVEPGGNDLVVAEGSQVLEQPGDRLVLEEAAGNPDEELTVTVVVVAVGPDGESMVVYRDDGSL
jgi:flagellin-like protein